MRTAMRMIGTGITVLCLCGEARAQAPPDEWQVTLAPYLMAAAMNGTAGIGNQESDVHLSASDIFSNLQFGAMGYFEVKKGKWGAGADLIWMSLGSSTEGPVSANIDVDQGGFTFMGIRELAPAVDLRAGMVVNVLKQQIKFKRIDRTLSRDETWIDPLVGVKLHTPDRGGRWGLALMADVGGFGVGSDFMFNLQPTALVRITRSGGLALGYRWIYVNYENEGDDTQRRFLYDMTSSGPFIGFVSRF